MPGADAPAKKMEQLNVKARAKSEEELAIIRSYRVPEFIPPYPYKTNPHAETAVAEARRWIEEQKFVELYRESTLPALYNTNAAMLPPKIYTEAGEKELPWICKYYVWAFVLDDQLDDEEYFLNPEKAVSLYLELNLIVLWTFPDDPVLLSNLPQFFDKAPAEFRQAHVNNIEAKLAEARKSPGTVYDTTKSGPICTSFGDLWHTLVESKSPEFCLRFGRSLQKYFIGNADETVIRKNNYTPSVAEYIPIRRNSVAMESLMVIIEYLDKVDVSEELFRTPEMQQLLLAINDIVAWHNDIWSFKKEVLLGDVHNLVYLLSLERKCSYVEGSKVALQMMLDRIDDMERASAALLQIAEPHDKPAIQQYVKNCRTFIPGLQDWHIGNKRYNF